MEAFINDSLIVFTDKLFFELNTKSFDLSGSLEYKVRNYLKKQLFRGSISLFIKVDSKDTFKFNSHKTSSVLKAYKEIEKKHEGINFRIDSISNQKDDIDELDNLN